MSTHPIFVEDRDLRSRRHSIFHNFALEPYFQSPWADEATRWMERARRDIDTFVPHIMDFEPLAAMEQTMSRISDEMNSIEHREFDPGLAVEHPGELNFLKDAYEVGKDGALTFKAYFNVKNFLPEHIKVTTKNNQLHVLAKKSEHTDGGSVSESCGRSIVLPESVDKGKLKAFVTRDGVLTIEVPVKKPNYAAIRMHPEMGMITHPLTGPEHKQLALKKKEGLEIMTQDDGKKKVHLELTVAPDFNSDGVKVWTEANKLFVCGQKEKRVEETSEGGDVFKSHATSQFTKAYVVPGVLDAGAIQAEMNDGHLVVEAPLIDLN